MLCSFLLYSALFYYSILYCWDECSPPSSLKRWGCPPMDAHLHLLRRDGDAHISIKRVEVGIPISFKRMDVGIPISFKRVEVGIPISLDTVQVNIPTTNNIIY